MRRVLVLGAGGRDFHDFNVAMRDDPDTRVVAFTAAQIPGIDHRVYPPALSGPHHPDGIPIRPEAELEEIVRTEHVDDVVLAYSDLSHEAVMHLASRALAAGAGFRLLGPRETMLRSRRPVVAVCATRTGAGKSPTSRLVGRLLLAAGLRVALVRHPMPYGDLTAMRVQRFASLADVDAAHPTIEEREEYEAPVRLGMTMWAGVDYAEILAGAESESDVIVWDGGNNDFPFFAPDVMLTVADALRPADQLTYHPGEVNVRMADVVVVNKVDGAAPGAVDRVVADVRRVNPAASIVRAASPVTLDPGPDLRGARVVVVEDGPTVTHGGMPYGAGAVAARAAGAVLLDPRRFAVGSIARTLADHPRLDAVVPAMGYSDAQIADLRATVRAAGADAVVAGTPIDLGRLLDVDVPVRRATYEVREVGEPTIADLLAPDVERWRAATDSPPPNGT